MIKEIRSTKIMEIEYSNNGEIAAHVCCIADHKKKELRIVDLFAVKDYAAASFEDMLMEEVMTYALENDIQRIVTFIGPEPYNPDPYRTIDDEVSWYNEYGFETVVSKCGFAACMEYQVTPPKSQEL